MSHQNSRNESGLKIKISPKCVCGRGSALHSARKLKALPRSPSWIKGGEGKENERRERREGRRGEGREGRTPPNQKSGYGLAIGLELGLERVISRIV